VKLLVKAKRLGYQETDIIDDEGVRPIQEANAGSWSNPKATGYGCQPALPSLHSFDSTTFP
jgi:hypothetical protein